MPTNWSCISAHITDSLRLTLTITWHVLTDSVFASWWLMIICMIHILTFCILIVCDYTYFYTPSLILATQSNLSRIFIHFRASYSLLQGCAVVSPHLYWWAWLVFGFRGCGVRWSPVITSPTMFSSRWLSIQPRLFWWVELREHCKKYFPWTRVMDFYCSRGCYTRLLVLTASHVSSSTSVCRLCPVSSSSEALNPSRG